jgi:tetratricopeptide (TPR) repeat protein
LIHLRLARELRKLDHLEASLQSYKKAVELAPDMHGWRLAMARARFDVLDYEGAVNDVQYVLDHIPPGSPLELPANTLATVFHGHSQDRGRRFDPVFGSKDITPDQLKQWALMRADAWRMFVAGRYHEAEPMYRKLLQLNPRDPSAAHQFGLTLMQLGKCDEALKVFGKVSDLDPTEDQYNDIVFRMGQCLVELERWEEAFMHFRTLYDQAVQFEIQNKDNALPPMARAGEAAHSCRTGQPRQWTDVRRDVGAGRRGPSPDQGRARCRVGPAQTRACLGYRRRAGWP